MIRSLQVFLCALACVGPPLAALAAEPSPNSKSHPKILPREGDWERLREGAIQSETFRREIVEGRGSGTSYAERLVDKILYFQRATKRGLSTQRPKISHFEIDRNGLLNSLESESSLTHVGSGFSEFRGKWYGSWDTFDVDHDWGPSISPTPKWTIRSSNVSFRIAEAQYAWIGDGFGWNLVIEPGLDSEARVLLGAVYHSSKAAPRTVRLFRPHVGLRPGENQLIWITRGEVFFEEVRPASQDYVITGFRYERDESGEIRFQGEGFQAIYSRNAEPRTPFHTFPVDP